MATQSSVKSQSSAQVAFAEQIRDKLADTLELAQYQSLYNEIKARLATLELNQPTCILYNTRVCVCVCVCMCVCLCVCVFLKFSFSILFNFQILHYPRIFWP